MLFNKKGDWSWKWAGIIVLIIFTITMILFLSLNHWKLKEVAYAVNQWWRFKTFA